jgi:holo-[acyl-carrier protein] synthase
MSGSSSDLRGPGILECGVDIIEIHRVEEALDRWGERFLNRVYTPAEIALFRGRTQELATRWAAKEAVSKALGTGMSGVRWLDIEVLPDVRGKPELRLFGGAATRAQDLGLTHWSVSLSHSRDNAVAFVVAKSG